MLNVLWVILYSADCMVIITKTNTIFTVIKNVSEVIQNDFYFDKYRFLFSM